MLYTRAHVYMYVYLNIYMYIINNNCKWLEHKNSLKINIKCISIIMPL